MLIIPKKNSILAVGDQKIGNSTMEHQMLHGFRKG